MIPLAEAQAAVIGRVEVLPVVTVAPAAACGLVLAADVAAAEDQPPFDNTAMDGYALRAADATTAPAELDVVGLVAAGDPGEVEVGPGQAVRIMTGAPIPPGADAVVMVERTEPAGPDRVRILEPVAAGDHVRRAGDDLAAGTVAVAAGTEVTPAMVGVLASVGATEVRAVRRPVVGVLSTGDELVPSGPLRRGQIRDSNRPMLLATAAADGFDVVDLGWAPDDEAAIEAALAGGLGRCDALLTSGGVSVGDFDLVGAVLDRLGEMTWMQIAIKPAKPFAFGLAPAPDGGGTRPVFGLPGNPVSARVSYELLARPALRRMAGHPEARWHRAPLACVAPDGLRRRPDGKTHFLRVVLDRSTSPWGARPAGGQGSHQLAALAAADGLAVVPDGDGIAAGAPVAVVALGG